MSTYVAITRVRRREHLLIYRPFDREPYTHGEMEGTRMLLKKLRGESINWDEIEENHMPRRRCGKCKEEKYKHEFASEYEFM